MAITSTGLETKRFPEIIEELRQELLARSGNPNLDLSDTSLLGIINAVYANAVAEQQELLQALWGNLEVDSAEGIALDRLVAYIGLIRLGGVKSSGQLLFTGSANTVIPVGTQARDSSGRVVITTVIATLNSTLANRAILNPSVQNNTLYSVTINGNTYTYTSDVDATKAEIINGLVSAVGAVSGFTATNNADNTLDIISSTGLNDLTVSTNTVITTQFCGKRVAAEAVEVGDSLFEVGTINRLVIPRINLSVTNLTTWLVGRFPETDEDLRARHRASTAITGKATLDAITSKLNQVGGVTKAFVDENPTDTTDINGLPPHSIECTVKGGSDSDIALTIWQNKAGGIQTHGNTTVEVLDISGQTRDVSFSRPVPRYIHLRITYSKFSEEDFPVDGETSMRQAASNYGESLDLGVDVIPPRFLGAIYSAVSGIGTMVVEGAVTTLPTDVPASYSTAIIPIAAKEESNFDLARISVIEV